MRKFISVLFLCIFTCGIGLSQQNQQVRYVKESVLSNGVKVMLKEDFRTPLVVVGFVFPVGLFNVPIGCQNILKLVAANLINQKLSKYFKTSSISYSIEVHKEYTEVIAIMHPSDLKDFFIAVCENISEISFENLEIQKKQMLIDKKLDEITGVNVFDECLFSAIDVDGINTVNILSSELSITSVTGQKCQDFYDKYFKRSPFTIIISGAVGYKSLIKILQTTVSGLPKRELYTVVNRKYKNFCEKNISVISKFLGNGVGYVYWIPNEIDSKFSDIYFEIFNYRIRKFLLTNSYPIISGCFYYDFSDGGSVQCVYFSPKSDVTLKKVKSSYDELLYRMAEEKISAEELEEISKNAQMDLQFFSSDLIDAYQKICDAYVSGKNANDAYKIAENLKNADPNEVNHFTKEILLPNLLLEIQTRYKADE